MKKTKQFAAFAVAATLVAAAWFLFSGGDSSAPTKRGTFVPAPEALSVSGTAGNDASPGSGGTSHGYSVSGSEIAAADPVASSRIATVAQTFEEDAALSLHSGNGGAPTPAPGSGRPVTPIKLDADGKPVWPRPSASRYAGTVVDYREIELPPEEKGGEPGLLKEWLIEPDEGYTAHVEETWRPGKAEGLELVDTREYVANQVVLTLDGETPFDEFKAKVEESGAIVKAPLMELEKGAKIVAVSYPDVSFDSIVEINDAIAAYDPRIKTELDGIGYIDRVPDDARWSVQWGMSKIKAPEAWNIRTDASSVVVAVIDTGVNYTHEDLAANMWVNPQQGTFRDVSGDRYGLRSIGGVLSGNPMDDNNHGSNCAGIIGAVGNNSKGVSGVAWRTKIMALKWLNSSGGGAATDLLNCLAYAKAKGADIVSCSFWENNSDALRNAYAALQSSGIIAVCSAGNNSVNTDNQPQYPSCYSFDNIVSVAATTSADVLASFSNYGSTSVDIAAPGYGIYSCGCQSSSAYTQMSGTSQAAPHVAGALALVKAQYPSYSYRQLIQRIFDSGDAVSSLSGKVATGKRLDVQAAIESQQLVSPAPTATRGTYANKVSVTWSSVSGATHYRVYKATSPTGTKTALGSWQTSTSYADSSVTAGVNYYYWVCAASSSSGANQSAFGSYDIGFAQSSGDSWDPGDDTPGGAIQIVPSTTRQSHSGHTLGATDFYDFFKIQMTAGVKYTFESTSPATVVLDTYGELFNSASINTASRVAYNDDIASTNRNFKIEFTPTSSGTYYLRVRAYCLGTAGSYALSYQRSGASDTWDPTDDVASGGTSLSPSDTERSHGPHTLSPNDLYDFFRISMTAGRKYVFETTGSSDTYGELFNSSSTNAASRVAYHDDIASTNRNFKIEYAPAASGTYYLRVRKYSVGTDGEYVLRYSSRESSACDIGFSRYAGWSDSVVVTASTNTMQAGSTFRTGQPLWVCFEWSETNLRAVTAPVTNCLRVVNQATGVVLVHWMWVYSGGAAANRYYAVQTGDCRGLDPGSYTARIALNEDGNGNRGFGETTFTNNVRTVSFTVANPEKTLSSIAISGNDTIAAKTSADYRCTATYSDGSTAFVSPTWSISPSVSYASVTSSGRVTAGEPLLTSYATLRASFGGKTATKQIGIIGTGTSTPSPESPFPAIVSYPRAPMVVEAVVYVDDVLASAGDQIAACVGGEIRGVAQVDFSGRATIGVNVAELGETVSFKVWDASDGDGGTIRECLQTLSATSSPQGTADSPIRIDAVDSDPFGPATVEALVPPTIVEATVTIDGGPASYGDILAVFSGETVVAKVPVSYVSRNGMAVATARPVMFFSGRKTLTFRLWDADERKILDSPATLTLSAGDLETRTIDFSSASDDDPCFVTLRNGWNLISFSVLPESPVPSAVFAPVSGAVQYVSDAAGRLWSPSLSAPSLSSLSLGSGYWVRSSATTNVSWFVEGHGDSDTEIRLAAGWNLIGYTLPRAGQVANVMRTALASGKIQYISDQTGNIHPGGTLGGIGPGCGYWIRATGAYTLVFDRDGMDDGFSSASVLSGEDGGSDHPFGTPTSRIGAPTVFENVEVSVFGKPAAFGDVVAVFNDGMDELVAVHKVDSEDGTMTFSILGVSANETLRFKVWNSASGLETPEIYDASGSFTVSNPSETVSGLSIVVDGTAPSYAVVYDLGENGARIGGGELQQTVAFGDDAVDPVVAANAGYRFVGWDYSKRTGIRGPATFTAIYGVVETSGSSPVHRFYSKVYKGHFFTIAEEEKDTLIATNPNWKYEGPAYRAFTNQVAGTTALYRFYSKSYRGHFFTTDENEKDGIIAGNPNWKYEGIAYYVYPSEVGGSVPVFRFYSKRYRHHFYTTDEAEKDNLIKTNPNWKYEGIAFHALPPETRTDGAAKLLSRNSAPVEDADAERVPRLPGFGVSDADGFTLEVRDEVPEADELAKCGTATEEFRTFRAVLPEGAPFAVLWNADTGEKEIVEAEEDGTAIIDLPGDGIWRWLFVDPGLSLWLRLVP